MANPNGEAHAIQCKIRQVENTIWQQIEEVTRQYKGRAALSRRLNSIQSSTAALPVETLSLIFKYACTRNSSPCSLDGSHDHPLYQCTHPALTLSHVSSHWRQVARSTPQLWNSVALVNEKNTGGVFRLLDLYLRKAKNLPFDLTIDRKMMGSHIFALVKERAGKFRSLKLFDPTLEWIAFISANCPQLECLSIKGIMQRSNLNFSLETLPLLRHLHLTQMATPVSLPWASITHLHLTRVAINMCAKLLTQCPNLVAFRSAYPWRAMPIFTAPTRITTLHHLKTLFWGYVDSPWCLSMLQYVRLPALHTFSWSEAGQRINDPHPFISNDLFAHLPDTMATLVLAGAESWTLPSVRYVFGLTHHVRNLILDGCRGGLVCEVLCALCPGWEGDKTEYLPSLEYLELELLSLYLPPQIQQLDWEHSEQILSLCRAKHAGPVPRFTLVFRRIEVDWAPRVQKELCRMVRDGFPLEIWETGRRVDWLP